jgi:hypothetical protein
MKTKTIQVTGKTRKEQKKIISEAITDVLSPANTNTKERRLLAQQMMQETINNIYAMGLEAHIDAHLILFDSNGDATDECMFWLGDNSEITKINYEDVLDVIYKVDYEMNH